MDGVMQIEIRGDVVGVVLDDDDEDKLAMEIANAESMPLSA
jgi:hypothetical protein